MGWVMIAILILLVAAGLLILKNMSKHAFENHLIDHRIVIKELPRAFHKYKIFFISDIHRRVIEKELLDLITETPDIIIIGGDLAEEGVPFSQIENNLIKLKHIAPLYFVWGNHDLFLNETILKELLTKHGVIVLENKTIQLQKKYAQINLSGVHDVTNERDDLKKTYENRVPGPVILISHNPDIKKQLNANDPIDLVISGHTHGGQIRIFGFGIREKGGIKLHDFGQLMISNGYGTTRWPLRWGAKPDTLYITLESGDL